YINTPSWDRPTICYDDDDDEDYAIVVTPSLSTEDPDNSLSMRDEHLDTILATELDEFIKSTIESLVPTPSKSKGILDNMCDMPFHDNSPPLNVLKDQFEDFSNSNDESTSIDDDSFFIDNIEYVEVSPPNSELVCSEVMKIVIPKSSSTSLNSNLEETNTFDNSLPEFEIFCFDLEEISSGSTTTRYGISLPEYEAFYDDHVKKISSGSTTTRSDISLPEYEAFYDDHVIKISSGSTTTHSDSSLYALFIFDLSINPFPPTDRSDFYEFADELIHMDVVEDIFPRREPRVHVKPT
nr:hypothetical protein [Tanacetum cinerariifolium]